MNKPDSFYKIDNLKNNELIDQINFVKQLTFDVDNYYNESYNRDEHFPKCVSYPIIDQFKHVNSDSTKFIMSIPHLIKKLRDEYGPGKFWKVFYAKLPSKGKILEHYDGGLGFTLSHRIHVPIKTNKNVLFSVDGEKREFNQGEIIEINNIKDHFVENNDPNEDRIHLIMDFITVNYMNMIL